MHPKCVANCAQRKSKRGPAGFAELAILLASPVIGCEGSTVDYSLRHRCLRCESACKKANCKVAFARYRIRALASNRGSVCHVKGHKGHVKHCQTFKQASRTIQHSTHQHFRSLAICGHLNLCFDLHPQSQEFWRNVDFGTSKENTSELGKDEGPAALQSILCKNLVRPKVRRQYVAAWIAN